MPGKRVERDDVGVGEDPDLVQAEHIRHHGPAAYIDVDARCSQSFALDRDDIGPFEARMAPNELDISHAEQPVLVARAPIADNSVGPCCDGLHVDIDGSGAEAIVRAALRGADRVGARDQRLGRAAAGVDACAADMMPLDDGDRQAGIVQPAGERRARLAGADDDRVEAAHDEDTS